jgi:putative tryptophan/tyrosine transport system substrate-binding protein
MKRREFITLVCGAGAAWPLAASAQQGEQVRRIGMLFGQTLSDPAVLPRIAAFRQALQQLGWTEGRNLRIDTRWSSDNADDTRKYAAELVGFVPDVIVSSGTIAAVACSRRPARCRLCSL